MRHSRGRENAPWRSCLRVQSQDDVRAASMRHRLAPPNLAADRAPHQLSPAACSRSRRRRSGAQVPPIVHVTLGSTKGALGLLLRPVRCTLEQLLPRGHPSDANGEATDFAARGFGDSELGMAPVRATSAHETKRGNPLVEPNGARGTRTPDLLGAIRNIKSSRVPVGRAPVQRHGSLPIPYDFALDVSPVIVCLSFLGLRLWLAVPPATLG